MKLSTFVVATIGIVGAAAQRSFIANPIAGTTISPGQHITVQVIRPNSLQGSTEVGLVIALLQCREDPCPPPSSQLGNVLYNGQYNPVLHEQPGRPYQNFTVTVPGFQAGDGLNKAQLATARFHLIGAGPSPTLELNTVQLNLKF
ncbi:hypothetical protein CPB83DRAFT_898020 [Crepidotus variabilis]|uniref:Uncharacterized protein n=1 Tax=Crepidotus variabilis TaxID=179855 RepID=A0A9P6JKJ2_9AGAR|nr:hypothetical protein CPB83DRAFT_898020 [Crepidotus variabilis]